MLTCVVCEPDRANANHLVSRRRLGAIVAALVLFGTQSAFASDVGPDLSPYCTGDTCCAEEACSTPDAKAAAKELRDALSKATNFDSIADAQPRVKLLNADKKSAFKGIDKVVVERLQKLGAEEVTAAVKADKWEDVLGIVDQRAQKGALDATWVSHQLTTLTKAATASSKVKSVELKLTRDQAALPVPEDLAALRALDARWRAIAASENASKVAATASTSTAAIEKTTAAIDAKVGEASTRLLKALLAADRYSDAEALVESDKARTPSAWPEKSLEAIAQRRATTTLAVNECLASKKFEVCTVAADTMVATCDALEAMRTRGDGKKESFLAAAQESELTRRQTSPDAPEPFTCNSTAKQKLAEMLQKTWKGQDDDTLEKTVTALHVTDDKCDKSTAGAWWDGRYCDGVTAFQRVAAAARQIVRGHVTPLIASEARGANYDNARSIATRWGGFLGEAWSASEEKEIQRINDANDAAERARQAAAEAAERAKQQACVGTCMGMVIACGSGPYFRACGLFDQCCTPAPSDCRSTCGVVADW